MKIFETSAACLILALFMSSCGNTAQATVVPSITSTPDLCGSAFLPGEVDKAHKWMREFDDATLLGTNTPRDQLPPVISDMQRIRRAAEDQIVPPCLANLKSLQLAHMNTVINTLVSFLSGASQDVLNQGAELAREQHNAYAVEYARLLGLTVVVPPTSTPGVSLTDTPIPATPVALQVSNPGTEDLNLYSDPSLDSTIVAVLFPGQLARMVGQTEDGLWVQVEIPEQAGQFGWIETASVSLSPVP